MMRQHIFPALIGALLASAGVAGCGGGGDDLGLTGGSTSGDVVIPDEPLVPANGGIRRLTVPQYKGSVRVLFGELAAGAATPPGDQPHKGYDTIGGAELTLSASAIDQYESSARQIAQTVVTQAPDRLPCMPAAADDAACFEQIARKIGRLAFRRPLNDDEVGKLVATAKTAAEAFGKGSAGAEAIVSALLQMPSFLYIVELGTPDAEDPTFRRLSPLELVTRISFFLLNATPDEGMLDAAESGELSDEDGIRAFAAKVLARPEAKAMLDTFYSEIFRLREIEIMQKDPTKFVPLTDSLKASMRDETLQLIREIVWTKDSDARALFDARETFINGDLAGLYGVPAPTGGGFGKVKLPENQQRMGILGHAGLLSVLSHTNETSPTRRGLFIQANLLCNPVPPPPAGVVTILPADDGTHKTMKEKLKIHMGEQQCAQCHGLMDPIGFALEHFDGIGAYRNDDEGLAIDPSGSVPDLGDFADASALATLVHDDVRSTQCMVRHLYRHAMGHLETKGESGSLKTLDKAFESSGYRIQRALVEICSNEAFRVVGEPK